MRTRRFRIALDGLEVGSVSAIADEPKGNARGTLVLFAHGAELDFDSEFMREIATLLAARGMHVLRFRYPYMERREREAKKFPPDRMPMLEDAHSRVLEFARREHGAGRIILAGKSMGSRVSTHLAAQGANAAGLIAFGYPLNPARNPAGDRTRSEHFPAIVQPMLFVQGTRDPLCDLGRLRTALTHFGGRATLAVIDGADHSFEVPRRSGLAAETVRTKIVDAVDAWERASFPD